MVKKKKRGKIGVMLAILLILTAACFFAGMILGGRLGTILSASANGADTIGQDPLILFADRHEFQAGEPGTMALTVLCEEDVSEAVTITDDQGQTMAVLENDGSGRLETTIQIDGKTARYGQLTASSGETVSAPISFYVVPEITDDMGERFLSVCVDLGERAQQAGFEDPFSEDALETVAGWLREDERVQTVRTAGSGLLFATTDGLIGSYGMNRKSPNAFGYVDPEEAFTDDQGGKAMDSVYLSSEIPRTNTGILHLSPLAEDENVQYYGPFFRDSEEELAEKTGGSLTWTESGNAIRQLVNGGFTDYGLVVVNTHGNQVEREDGSKLLLMSMGEREKDQVQELIDMLDYKDDVTRIDGYASLWGIVDRTDTIRWMVDISLDDEGGLVYSLFMTGNYMECALGDKVFDNTILYFIVCYGYSDQQMVDLLHRHGASAFIGCREAFNVGISVAYLEQMAQTMGNAGSAWAYGTLLDTAKPYSDAVDELIRTTICPEAEDYQDYQKALRERPLRFSFLGDGGGRVFSGQGKVKGAVLDQDLKAAADATVTLYQWLDHDFRQVWTGQTGADGVYQAEKIPYGIYGVCAEKDGAVGMGTLVVDDGSRTQEAKDVVLDWTGAENNGGNAVRYRGNVYYWKYNGQSLSDTGSFAYFPYVHQTTNQLICRHGDGSEDVLLSARGNGPIFIVGGRIYLEEDGVDLFSVDLKGGNRVDHGDFEPWAADESGGTLIGSYGTDGGVYVLKGKDHTLSTVNPEGRYFLGTIDGYCYYSSVDTQGIPRAILWKTSVDGSETTNLSAVEGSVDWLAGGFNIYQVTKSGDQIYYSYGYYAGTGGFFQQGGINCVDLEGNETRTVVDYDGLGAEEFQVIEDDGETRLYYIGPDDAIGSYIGFWDDYPYSKCHVKTKAAGEDTWTDSTSNDRLSRPGSYVCIDGEIRQFDPETGGYRTLIPKEAGFYFIDRPQGSEDIALISTLDIMGDDLYFTVEWSYPEPVQLNWRPLYNRERSAFYTMKIGESQPVLLYEY